MIIIEGPDNVGKDTQIKKIQKYFYEKYKEPLVKVHCSYFGINDPELALEEYIRISELDLIYSIIANRLHIGELVYGPLYRNYSDKEIERVLEFEKIFLKDSILFIFIDNPKNLIKRDDGQSFSINLEKKQKEIALFKKAYELSNIKNKFLINIEDKNENDVFEIVKYFLERVKL